MSVESIAAKVLRRERLDAEEAKLLWEEAPLWLLSKLACGLKREKSGEKVFYNRNYHVEPTNICRFACRFCSYRRHKGEAGAWEYSLDEIVEQVRARKGVGATEVHIVGGVHPDRDLDYYVEMISRIKAVEPTICVKAFTAVELHYMITRAGLSLSEGLRRLAEAGMESIPGGGAEIFADEIRRQICPEKCSSEEWLALHREAHKIGLDSNATMLYGHIESIDHRIDHLLRLRELQDETGGINAFIPLKFRSANNGMEAIGETSVVDDMRTLAMSRILLDNVPHIKAYWVMYGKEVAEMALQFGADDIDGTIEDSTKIYSMAGAADTRPRLTIAEIEKMCAAAGYRAVERDTHYNEI